MSGPYMMPIDFLSWPIYQYKMCVFFIIKNVHAKP